MEPLVPPSSGIEFPLEKVVTEVCTMSSKGPLQPCPEWPPRMKYCCIYTAPLPLSRPAFWVCYSADKSTSVQANIYKLNVVLCIMLRFLGVWKFLVETIIIQLPHRPLWRLQLALHWPLSCAVCVYTTYVCPGGSLYCTGSRENTLGPGISVHCVCCMCVYMCVHT